MGTVCLLSNATFSTKGIQQSDLERWQQAGYAAVDELVVRLKDQIEGKDVEEISNLLREEGKKLTAALFEQMINSLGKEELQAKTHACPECNRMLRLRCSLYNGIFDEVFARYKHIHRSKKN